jgi:hypothetical protein
MRGIGELISVVPTALCLAANIRPPGYLPMGLEETVMVTWRQI